MAAVPTVLNARETVGGHANARQTVLARSAIASYIPPTSIEVPILCGRQSAFGSASRLSSDRGELACGDQDVIRHVLFHRRYQGWTGGHMVHAQCMRSACAVHADHFTTSRF
jgi:hypothetical protein